jgi:NADPH-dependent 2,4-dienoyl-CoA reductase/sulfur reductase-like enzyme
MEGYMPGKRVVILGSGDIGLIMARRMTLEGAEVLACVELMPYSGGLTRNIVQCLNDYNIPLYLSHTITEIRGKNRVEGVTVMKVDEQRKAIPGTEMQFDCDTVLLSVGLIPENELTRGAGIEMDSRTNGAVVTENMETSVPGVFACGNVVHVHDLVDFVTAESIRAGEAAASFVLDKPPAESAPRPLANGGGVSYTVPQRVRADRVARRVDVFFRVNRVFGESAVIVTAEGGEPLRYKRERLAPGEMERVALPKQFLERAKGTITISVEEAAQ